MTSIEQDRYIRTLLAALSIIGLSGLSSACLVEAEGTNEDSSVEGDYSSVGQAVQTVPTYYPIAPFQRIYSLYNSSTTDQLLTQDQNEQSWLLSIGWGSPTGDVIYLEKQPQPTTLPLRRFYKGLPQNEHFYTTSQADADAVTSWGWVDEGIVGYIYTEQVPGSVPLYRLTRFDGATGDLVHRYTLSSSVKATLQSQGFQYEGITGYVYTTSFPTVPGGRIFGARLGCNGVDFRDCTFGSFMSVNSIGPRPSGATTQVMRFKFWTPDMFATTSTASSGEHLVFAPRGILQANMSNLNTSTIHGIGLIIDAGDSGCSATDRTFIEEWWPISAPSPSVPDWSSYNFTSYSPPNTCGTRALLNRTWYDVVVSVSNTGFASYTIWRGGSLVWTSGSVQYGTSPETEAPFNSTATGYFITNAHGAVRDYTAYVTNLSVSWQ